jgi:hypothetical protein
MALLGVEVADAADPAYRSALRKADAWRRRRCSELARDHGGALSSGASALVASSALALAASRYVYGLAAAAGKLGAPLFAQAAALADKARQAELTAIDLASRESAARPKQQDPAVQERFRLLMEQRAREAAMNEQQVVDEAPAERFDEEEPLR